MNSEIFAINTRSVYRLEKNKQIKGWLAKFLVDQGEKKELAQLWDIYYKNKYGKRSDKTPSKDDDWAIRELWLNGFYLLEETLSHPDFKEYEKEYDFEPQGVWLDQPYPIDFEKHGLWYRKFFASILSKIEWPKEFLEFHFTNTFKNDLKEYQLFLTLILGDYISILQPRKTFIEKWMNGFDESHRDSKKPSELQIPSVSQLALSIYYKQAAGTFPVFVEGEKTEAIKKIVKVYGISPNTFDSFYRKFSKQGGKQARVDAINTLDNYSKVKELLKDDQKATVELEKEKPSNPLP